MHANVRSLRDYRTNVTSRNLQPAVGLSRPPDAPKPKLLDQVRLAIRTRHYSVKTEEAYVGWIKRFIFFHNKRHPAEMDEQEIAQFPTVDGGNDNLQAAAGIVMFPSVTSFTASSRNSFVYLPCGIPFILTPPSLYFIRLWCPVFPSYLNSLALSGPCSPRVPPTSALRPRPLRRAIANGRYTRSSNAHAHSAYKSPVPCRLGRVSWKVSPFSAHSMIAHR